MLSDENIVMHESIYVLEFLQGNFFLLRFVVILTNRLVIFRKHVHFLLSLSFLFDNGMHFFVLSFLFYLLEILKVTKYFSTEVDSNFSV
jgi:hypothetical protein